MAITRDFRETVREHIQGDPEFRAALLEECRECVRIGDAATAKSMLTQYAAAMGISEASDVGDLDALRRTLGPDGVASDADLLAVIEALREREEASAMAVPAGAQP